MRKLVFLWVVMWSLSGMGQGEDLPELPGLPGLPDLPALESESSLPGSSILSDSPLSPPAQEEVPQNGVIDLTDLVIYTDAPAPSRKPREFTDGENRLLKRIQRTLRIYRQISMATAENAPADIMAFIVPFGCKVEIYEGSREAENHINAIGALCWNVPMGEEVAFGGKETLLPRVGYGVQHYPGQLLGTMAMARVSIRYRFPAGGNRSFTVEDLIGFEKERCQEGQDLSAVLIGLAYYTPWEATWETNDEEVWDLERVLRNELNRKVDLSEAESVRRLLGLTYALRCLKMHKKEPYGEFLRAKKFIDAFRLHALSLTNAAGCWHPQYFAYKGTSRDLTAMLISSGTILRWLVAATPVSELSDEKLQKAVSVVEALLYQHLSRWDASNASPREIEGVCAALHALALYQKRYFRQ
ncbi:MAG: hypothetical protein Q4D98_13260 [Planctomycetia bacterium]|nr:hypothetical protein [Planctomycetia bacterium]